MTTTSRMWSLRSTNGCNKPLLHKMYPVMWISPWKLLLVLRCVDHVDLAAPKAALASKLETAMTKRMRSRTGPLSSLMVLKVPDLIAPHLWSKLVRSQIDVLVLQELKRVPLSRNSHQQLNTMTTRRRMFRHVSRSSQMGVLLLEVASLFSRAEDQVWPQAKLKTTSTLRWTLTMMMVLSMWLRWMTMTMTMMIITRMRRLPRSARLTKKLMKRLRLHPLLRFHKLQL
mmetsp:Transcript_5262/g.10901  ORF Transcript_5262/g.10901 Transcript_5262/m.10901 type:complete len:228 (-) Transcript_5262:2269-2952(-)